MRHDQYSISHLVSPQKLPPRLSLPNPTPPNCASSKHAIQSSDTLSKSAIDSTTRFFDLAATRESKTSSPLDIGVGGRHRHTEQSNTHAEAMYP